MVSERVRDVSFSGIREFFELASSVEGVITLAVGEPDYPTPQHVKYAGIDAINDDFTTYTSNFGMIELRKAIAEKLKQENDVKVDPENGVILTSGSSEALDLAVRVLINPGEKVIVPEPGYVAYKPCVWFAGGEPVVVPTKVEDGFKPDLDELNELIDKKTKLMIFGTPANPTGTMYDENYIRKLAEIILDNDMYVVADEIYEKIVYDEHRHFSMASIPEIADRVVTTNGFSKAFAMTGWRLGYAAGSNEIIELMMKIHQYTMLCAPSIAQKAALAALTGPKDFLNDILKEFGTRRKTVVQELNKLPGVECSMPHGAFYAFPNIRGTGMSSTKFCERMLKEAKVAVVPGSNFGDAGEGFVRVCYAASLNNIRIAMKRMKELLEKIV